MGDAEFVTSLLPGLKYISGHGRSLNFDTVKCPDIADAVIFSGIYWAATYDSSVLHYITQQNMIITGLSVLGIGLTLAVVCTYFSVTHCLKMRGSELY